MGDTIFDTIFFFIIFFISTVRLFIVLASIALTSDEAVMEESGISSFSIPRGVIQSKRIVKKGKVSIQDEGPIRLALSSGFTSIRRRGVFLLPLYGMLVHQRVIPHHYFRSYPFIPIHEVGGRKKL